MGLPKVARTRREADHLALATLNTSLRNEIRERERAERFFHAPQSTARRRAPRRRYGARTQQRSDDHHEQPSHFNVAKATFRSRPRESLTALYEEDASLRPPPRP